MLNFRDIKPEHKGLFTDYLKPFNFDNSEFSFSNLYIWREGYGIHFAPTDIALYIDGIANEKRTHFQPILRDESQINEVMLNICEDLSAKSGDIVIASVNSYFMELIDKYCKDIYIVKEDRSMFDYVYTAEQLALLRGKRMHGKKNHYNRFVKTYEYEYKELVKEDLEDCLKIFDKWAISRAIMPCDEQERCAIIDAVTYMDDLELSGAIIYVSGMPAAFTIGGRLNETMAVILLEKADPDIMGAYAAINKEYILYKWLDKVEFINREEDMGIEGLMRAKLSYKPCRLIEKFDIYLK